MARSGRLAGCWEVDSQNLWEVGGWPPKKIGLRLTSRLPISRMEFINDTQSLFNTYIIMNIYQINKYICSAVFMHSHSKGMLPDIFNEFFTLKLSQHHHNTSRKRFII